MMSYSNIYDAIPICRTHARTEPVRTPKFSSDNASDKRQFCHLSLALSLPVRSHLKTELMIANVPVTSENRINNASVIE